MQIPSITGIFEYTNSVAKFLVDFFDSKGVILTPKKDSFGNVVFRTEDEDGNFYIVFSSPIVIGDSSIDRGHTVSFYVNPENKLYVEIKGRGWITNQNVVTYPALELDDTNTLEKIAGCVLIILKDTDAKYFEPYQAMSPGYHYQKTWEAFRLAFNNGYVLEEQEI